MTNVLEIRVRLVGRTLHHHQMLRLYKIPNDIKVVNGELIHAERGPADFMGYTITGRAVMIECKMCKGPSLSLGSSGLKPHQHKALIELEKAGGIALLVWQRGDEIAVIDSDQIKHLVVGRKSIPWKMIPARHKRRVDCDPLQFFWPWISKS